jgi:Glycosyl hydrolases family 28
LFCENFIARNLTIRTVNLNGDGIDVDSCDGVTIEHCDINTGDDAISLKSGRGLAAQNLSRPTQNVVIRDCRLESSIFAAIGFGTEMSGGVRDVKIQNCILSGHQNAIYIKSREGRGGYMENISGENLTILKSPTFVGINLMEKGIQATDPVMGDVAKWPLVKNISFKNIRVQDVRELVVGNDIPAVRPIQGFTLADISGTCTRGIAIANMTNVSLAAIHVTGFNGPLVSAENVTGSGLDDSAAK